MPDRGGKVDGSNKVREYEFGDSASSEKRIQLTQPHAQTAVLSAGSMAFLSCGFR